MKTINILTGPIQSGKTTRLIAWVKYHRNSAGILSPVIHNQRFIYSILANDYRRLESIDDLIVDKEIVKIGKYSFLQSTFKWAREELHTALEHNPPYLVIDEIGPLELSGKGLEPMVTNILQSYKRSPKHRLVLVVRENLLEEVISHYGLDDLYLSDHNFLSTP
jgi:nucleoside-triphosphatase THEP1